jgi:hypothetical protein
MVLALLLGCLTTALVVATRASSPATTASRRRTAARRARFVASHPTQVNSADVVAALGREGMSPAQARLVTDRALAHDIRPFTMWLWIEQHGGAALGVVVAADVTHRELLTHLSEGTAPDLDELGLFATANGLDLDALPLPRPRRTTSAPRTRRRSLATPESRLRHPA